MIGFGWAAAISSDGRFIAYTDSSHEPNQILVYDQTLATTEVVSVDNTGVIGNAGSFGVPVLSADGRFVAFGSEATNLVPGDTNQGWDIFVRDRLLGTTEIASVNSSGNRTELYGMSFEPGISDDGSIVVFTSSSSTLVADDTNYAWDVFSHDRASGITERVSVSNTGAQGYNGSWAPSISADGRFVAYRTSDIFVTGDTNGETDIYEYDRVNRSVKRVSLSSCGTQGNGESDQPVLNASGRFIAFMSYATNLVGNDTNEVGDVFIYDRQWDSVEPNDTVPPTIEVSATPNILSPANGQLVDVTINGAVCDDLSGIASMEISVTDEYGVYDMTVPGFGSVIQLKAKRDNKDKDGRHYTITVVASDMAGNQATAMTEVIVP